MGIRNIVNTRRSNFKQQTEITANGKPVDSPEDVSNTFNNFFTSSGPDMEQSIPKSQ